MKKMIKYLPQAASWFFILLFIYAGVSKMLDFENFQVQIGQSPLLSAWAGFVSYAVIAAELLICGLLVYRGTQPAGLYASYALMVAFTVYIYLILNFSDFIPCSCGGILEKMSWTEHLLFNMACVVLAAAAIWITGRSRLRSNGRILTYMGVLLAAAFGLLVALFYSSEHIIKKENNFTRRFFKHPFGEMSSYDLKDSGFYFAGSGNGEIYLGNRNYPQRLNTISSNFSDLTVLNIEPEDMSYPFRNLEVQVQYPNYYFYDGTVPIIYKGRLGNPKAHIISYQDAYFNQMKVIDSVSFAVRTQNREDKSLTLGMIRLHNKPPFSFKPGILERQADGVFDMDGNLLRDSGTPLFVYIYAYRNEFTVTDSSLQLKRKLNTIDTTSIAKVETVALSDGRRKMSRPPVRVNAHAYVHNGVLLNRSNLMGRHEPRKAWQKNAVVDVYRTEEQVYLGSFYLPQSKEEPIRDFMIQGESLYILAGTKIAGYPMRKQILKYFMKGDAENPDPE